MSEIMTVDRTTALWDGNEAAFFPLLPSSNDRRMSHE